MDGDSPVVNSEHLFYAQGVERDHTRITFSRAQYAALRLRGRLMLLAVLLTGVALGLLLALAAGI